MPDVQVVSHTHWDREWYHPAERFRQALVELIDELIDDPPVLPAAFLLDGQAVVLEDYLDVRPERAAELSALLRQGRVEAGPWFVLADELIPGAEALVRNLLMGRRVLRAQRVTAPPVLYCPDSFGHPAALPELAQGFGATLIIAWRGLGGRRYPQTSLARWRAPSGAATTVYALTRSGYELGSTLPVDVTDARRRWIRIAGEYGARRAIGPELLLNGADHHARQRDLPGALAALREAAAPDEVSPGSLSAFASAIAASPSVDLPVIEGEQRDSYGHTWTLQGTFATRTPQKRRYALAERELVRDVEPWMALAPVPRGGSDALLRAAWRELLLCQPHDTLCGCSLDQVARAMDARLEAVVAQAEGLRQRAIHAILGHDPEVARTSPDRWTPTLIVRNRAARRRSGVALVGVSIKLGDVAVGPGSAAVPVRASELPEGAEITHERTESPRAYPDNDAVVKVHTALWIADAPAHGLVALPLERASFAAPPAGEEVRASGRVISNGRLRLSWDRTGRLALRDRAARREIRGLLSWESRGDVGDLYTPAIRGPKLRARLLRSVVIEQGPLVGVLEQHWRLAARGEHVDLRLRVVLEAGAPFLRFGVLGDNAARDHRLRLVVRTGLRRARVWADAAFGPVDRRPLKVTAAAARIERPLPTEPLHRYVSAFEGRRGTTLFADGSTEYESRPGALAVTLVRAVGQLSRNDLPERPGHAGWPEPTPEAQCQGPFAAEFGLLLHGARTPHVIREIEATSDDVLYPLTGETLRSALGVPGPVAELELAGPGLSFSCAKPSEDGQGVVLRCVNLLDRDVAGTWRLAGRPYSTAHRARLDETPQAALAVDENVIHFTAGPRAVVTILVR